MPRLEQPIRKTAMILVQSVSEGKVTFRREPYNIVSLDFGDGSPVNTYMEPVCGRPLSPLERAEVYDEIRTYDSPPFPSSRVGSAV